METIKCEMCGREVGQTDYPDYITGAEGEIICKVCAFDVLEENFILLQRVVRHLRDALSASARPLVMLNKALKDLPDDVLQLITETDDADTASTEA